MAEPTPAVDPAEIEAGAEAIRRANPHAAPQPTEAAEQVLSAVLPDHDAQVRVPLLSLIADLADDGPCHYDHNSSATCWPVTACPWPRSTPALMTWRCGSPACRRPGPAIGFVAERRGEVDLETLPMVAARSEHG